MYGMHGIFPHRNRFLTLPYSYRTPKSLSNFNLTLTNVYSDWRATVVHKMTCEVTLCCIIEAST